MYIIKDEIGEVLIVPSVSEWHSVYHGVACLVDVFDDKETLRGLQRACTALKIPCLTPGE